MCKASERASERVSNEHSHSLFVFFFAFSLFSFPFQNATMSQGDAQNRPNSSPSSSRLVATLRRSRSMRRLASDGEHASRLVLLTSLVVGVALGSLLPPDISGAA